MASQKLCAGCLRLPATPAGPPPPLRRPHSPHSNALQIQRSRAPGSLHSCPPARSSAASFARAGYCVLFKVSRQNGWSRHALLRHPRSRQHRSRERARNQSSIHRCHVCVSRLVPLPTFQPGLRVLLSRLFALPFITCPRDLSLSCSLALHLLLPPPSSSFLLLPPRRLSATAPDAKHTRNNTQSSHRHACSILAHTARKLSSRP